MNASGYTFRRSPSSHGALLIWSAVVETPSHYTDAGNEFWGLAFNRDLKGHVSATLMGPSMQPRHIASRAGDVSWGVEFPAHVFLQSVPKLSLVDAMQPLHVDGAAFEVAGERFKIPEYDDLESLVNLMHRRDMLSFDPTVSKALSGASVKVSERQMRRRATNAAGLSPKQVSQLHRARTAYRLLHDGHSLATAAVTAGYADQAHMTRAMRTIGGLTPAKMLTAKSDPFSSRPLI